MDTDNSGTLEPAELLQGLQTAGFDVTSSDITKLIDKIEFDE